MALFDIFSMRNKRQTSMVVDVYQYDHISDQLRVQIVFIIENVLEWLPHEKKKGIQMRKKKKK
jgi:hypothetical protein